MAASPRPESFLPHHAQIDWFVPDLLKLQRAAHAISSTLDLDELLNKVVHEVVGWFGCMESSIWLHDEEKDELVLAGVCGCTVHTESGIRLKVGEKGMVGHVAAHGITRYAPDVNQDPYYIRCEPSTTSELDIPLKVGSKVIGVFSASHPDKDAFAPDLRRLMEALCAHIASAVENARAFRRERDQRERMEKEAREARFIQESLLPKISPLVPGMALEALSVPAGEVGGDWYDYIDLGDDRWGIVLADVSGKGMAAALLMSATRGVLRSLARAHQSPATVLSKLNCVLRDDFPAGRYVTMIYAVLDTKSHTLTFANAGHPHPVLAQDGHSELINGESGLPLGLASSVYADRSVKLTSGMKLLFYSDGISEATNAAQEEFGTERIREHLLREGSGSQTLMAAACEHAGHRAPSDDATAILVRCTATQ
jgi:phosphoserine phosphatase RsbU/P